jgi:hypothetical protein
MRGVYGHVSPAMRTELKAALQERWEQSLRDRARLAPRSSVRVLDGSWQTCGPPLPGSARLSTVATASREYLNIAHNQIYV